MSDQKPLFYVVLKPKAVDSWEDLIVPVTADHIKEANSLVGMREVTGFQITKEAAEQMAVQLTGESVGGALGFKYQKNDPAFTESNQAQSALPNGPELSPEERSMMNVLNFINATVYHFYTSWGGDTGRLNEYLLMCAGAFKEQYLKTLTPDLQECISEALADGYNAKTVLEVAEWCRSVKSPIDGGFHPALFYSLLMLWIFPGLKKHPEAWSIVELMRMREPLAIASGHFDAPEMEEEYSPQLSYESFRVSLQSRMQDDPVAKKLEEFFNGLPFGFLVTPPTLLDEREQGIFNHAVVNAEERLSELDRVLVEKYDLMGSIYFGPSLERHLR